MHRLPSHDRSKGSLEAPRTPAFSGNEIPSWALTSEQMSKATRKEVSCNPGALGGEGQGSDITWVCLLRPSRSPGFLVFPIQGSRPSILVGALTASKAGGKQHRTLPCAVLRWPPAPLADAKPSGKSISLLLPRQTLLIFHSPDDLPLPS